jgi:menaquinone-dependent protoporphyrinogen oxidase
MRVLITWGSERGGTEGIGRMLADGLRRDGIDVDARPSDGLASLAGYDAAIIGGAVYANRWHKDARRFVRRHVRELRRIPVWFFSSGPLDDTAERSELAPTRQVEALMERVGARGHRTFGGRLTPDAKGFPAQAMAKKSSGDWRKPERIRAWAGELAIALPTARPGVAVEPEARSLSRLLAYVLAASLLGVVARVAVAPLHVTGLAVALHAAAAVAIVIVIGRRYFSPRGARDPLPTGLWFATGLAIFDALALAVRTDDLATPVGIAAITISATAGLLAAWATGGLMSTMPWPRGPAAGAKA